jgi:hypothetical protein
MDDLDSTAGIVALAAAGGALLALLVATWLAIRLRRMRAAQRAVLGEAGTRDLVEHAQEMERRIAELGGHTNEVFRELTARTDETERRLEGAITHAAVVRYDAYNEMSGMQSSSIALLDDRHNGVVLSSILQRDHARLYAKPVIAGRSELGLSPEEEAAVEDALSGPAESTP